jgi:tetratricopeptide (TPR) repeat protein
MNAANGGAKLEVLPLKLPQRPLVTMPREGKLKVRLIDRPTEEFEIAWSNIDRVLVFEQVLMAEAQRLSAEGKFDAAYDYFVRLRAEHPNFPGLEEAIADYLQRNALALYQSKQHDRALALLLTLYQRNPSYTGLPQAVEAVAGEVIQRYLKEGNYSAARRVLDLWQTQFRGVAAEASANWQKRFESAARRQLAEATQLIGTKQYVQARKSMNRALAIWPTIDGGAAVMAQIEREFPFVTVGVLEAAPRQPTRRIDDWATLRTSRLTQRLLAEESDFGADGGVYRSSFGEWDLDDSGRELTLKMANQNAGLTADALSRFLLSMAKPGSKNYRSDFASLLGGVSIERAGAITLHLRRVHVRPESMLQVPPLDANGQPAAAGVFSVADFAPEQVVFTAPAGRQSAGPQAVVEQVMNNDESAVAALLAGDIDVLDRVPPWQIERLRTSQDVRIAAYKLPTVHVLIPNMKRPLMTRREFRRALCFGIDRKFIVDRVLLGGKAVPGYQPVSGPFPAGTSLNDPIRYAYNNQVLPRPFEPRLAAILSTVAWAAVQAPPAKNKDKQKEKPAPPSDKPIPELVLAYPNDPIARVACQSIEAQLKREGIAVKLREFTADELLSGKLEYDLRYAELTVGEPVTDARQILGPGGLAGDAQSPYLDAALREVDSATNWTEARTRLAALHEIASHELPVIPLWQTVNYFAYRATMRGIDESPVALYQNIAAWSVTPTGKVAQSETTGP